MFYIDDCCTNEEDSLHHSSLNIKRWKPSYIMYADTHAYSSHLQLRQMLKGRAVGKRSWARAFPLRQSSQAPSTKIPTSRPVAPQHSRREPTCSSNKVHLHVHSCCSHACLTHSSLNLWCAAAGVQRIYAFSCLAKPTCTLTLRPGTGTFHSGVPGIWQQPAGSLWPAWDIQGSVAYCPLSCCARELPQSGMLGPGPACQALHQLPPHWSSHHTACPTTLYSSSVSKTRKYSRDLFHCTELGALRCSFFLDLRIGALFVLVFYFKAQ